ncbi:MAG: T9SS type A sorting domain-containing protein [Prolixibacteraceae bacterium]|nr:T9SS type A sorting domain-containing protein [Prolixibacteraceae bacterium]
MRFTFILLALGFFILSGSAQKPAGSNISDSTLNIEYQTDKYEVKVYPNPAESGRVTIDMNNYELFEIRMIDIGGKEILLKKIAPGTSKTVLTINEIPNGIYFIKIKTTENKIYVKKLVVSSN